MEACYGKHREDYSLASSSSYYGKVTGRLIRDLSCFHTFSNLQLSVDSISELFWFYFPSLFLGPENSCLFFNQSDSKLNQIASWLTAFSRALDS